ncbi:hypothetical protein BN159_6146 [Streptomyces davaonensis JCM 4913]|uniref:DUF1877 family protein n=1 Tax=Streptomyces davaonensis (strain DSM 101723 / JCM 4913 / KCC S-0913 / 768) TaxID=1214101 RepID=K4RBC5_STRDJ|nr:DUF1877 family protein [Streptomyces davaonensis]CCK30525.1 hypothetical protein BN159_6146 [Streptomyces davaonensis JCM 4913]
MSIHLHFRAVAESEIRDDHTWLTEFMWAAWENLPQEYAAGIAWAIDKVWHSVDDLYAAAHALLEDADEPWTLPIYGGRPVAYGTTADPSNPPMMLLPPSEVSQAADFLARISFDELWDIAGAGLSGYGRGEAQAREEFLGYHRDLLGLYERAAAAHHAVVKVVWA